MAKFKVGDKVRCVEGYCDLLIEGKEYEVLDVPSFPDDENSYVSVNDERDREDGSWLESRFELVEESPVISLRKNDRVTDEAGNLGTVTANPDESGMVGVLFDRLGNNPLAATRMPVGKVTRVVDVVEEKETSIPEYTGGSSSYYKVSVQNPVSKGEPYTVECQDVIEALGMSFSEGNIFKAIWRICAAKNGKAKKGYEDSVYDLEKIIFFAQRELEIEKMKRGN